MRLEHLVVAAAAAVGAASPVLALSKPFFLKNGDRVCFYGDSITEQRYYTVDTEAYAVTRFPTMHFQFVNAGVGGDKVGGGWAGGIDQRLKRDVFPFKPTVVTIMLGMNDASYRPFNQGIFNTYRNGYKHLIKSLQKHLPGVRIVLIQTSPFDDITQKPQFPKGYNAVLVRYDQFVKRLAKRHHLLCVNFNGPMVHVMKVLKRTDPSAAGQVVPGRVHPSAAGELLMAQELIQGMHGPSTVTDVQLAAGKKKPLSAVNAAVTGLSAQGDTISWTEKDAALPWALFGLHENLPQFPPYDTSFRPKQNFAYTNPVTKAIIHVSHLYQRLDEERLLVRGLHAGKYRLAIDGKPVGTFSARTLAEGVNLARYDTPMLQQSYHVLHLAWHRTQMRYWGWRTVQLPVEGFGWNLPVLSLTKHKDRAIRAATEALAKAVYKNLPAEMKRERAAAQPKAHHFVLSPVQ